MAGAGVEEFLEGGLTVVPRLAGASVRLICLSAGLTVLLEFGETTSLLLTFSRVLLTSLRCSGTTITLFLMIGL